MTVVIGPKHGTAIEWTQRPGTRGETLNPIRARNIETGAMGWWCCHVNGDCTHCYAETLNVRGGDSGGNGIAYKAQLRDQVEIFLDEERLLKPLKWKNPRTIFLCSMTDLFAGFVKDEWLDEIFAGAALCSRHTFIMLTKRPKRMRQYLSDPGVKRRIIRAISAMRGFPPEHGETAILGCEWPLPNVWCGTSCGTQDAANEFIPELLATPAAIRFVSVEPMRGPVDLHSIPGPMNGSQRTYYDLAYSGGPGLFDQQGRRIRDARLDWVICGGEIGPKARPMHPAWPKDIRDQCAAAGVPFFFKHWGDWVPHTPVAGGDLSGDVRAGRVTTVHPTGQSDVEVFQATKGRNTIPGTRYVARIGKKAAGRTLDGVEHNGFPAVAA